MVIAEGIWYSETFGLQLISENDKQDILEHLNVESNYLSLIPGFLINSYSPGGDALLNIMSASLRTTA